MNRSNGKDGSGSNGPNRKPRGRYRDRKSRDQTEETQTKARERAGQPRTTTCATCHGRGVLYDSMKQPFRCPDCGGQSVPEATMDGAGGFRIPNEIWTVVCEAAKLEGESPKNWAIRAVHDAANYRITRGRT